MRIAQVATLWNSVPPAHYGGTERMIHLLVDDLMDRGHEVTLFASADSQTRAELVPVCARGVTDLMRSGHAYEYDRYLAQAVGMALEMAPRFDVIHFHLGTVSVPFAPLASVPTLHTVFTAPTVDDRWVVARHPDVAVTVLAAHQLDRLGVAGRSNVFVVPNGWDFDLDRFSPDPGRYLAFLGRTNRQKGIVEAVGIARAAGMPLVIAGGPGNRQEEAYFAHEVAPLVDGDRVRYLGPVDDEQKRVFFRGAAAFLFPIQWEEPFGVVMLEAMAAGVPVVACARGSVPDVVDEGITGFHAADPGDLPALVHRALALDRRRVRDHACRRFDVATMTSGYEQAYEQLQGRSPVALRRVGGQA
jgi:glycosyltransferase involved in cell wall biosynthesis